MDTVIIKLDQHVRIPVGESSVLVPATTILGDLLARLQPPAVVQSSAPPRIGEVWPGQGGVYAGVVRGAEGGADYHLVVQNTVEFVDINWADACARAKDITHEGHHDFTLPNRRDQSVAFANAKHLFADKVYWSSEVHAGDPDYAWGQLFNNGYQSGWVKAGTCRARAVRRLPIL